MPKHAGDWRNKPSKQSSKPYKGGHKAPCAVWAIALVGGLGAAAYAVVEAARLASYGPHGGDA